MSRAPKERCPLCDRDIALVGGAYASHNMIAYGEHGREPKKDRRCAGSGRIVAVVRAEARAAKAAAGLDAAKRRETEAEARLARIKDEIAQIKDRKARLTKRIEELTAQEIEITARLAQLEAQEPQR